MKVAKETCYVCGGSGKVPDYHGTDNMVECQKCGGTGEMEVPDDDES